MIFCLTDPRTLTLGCIEWNLDDAFTGSFLSVVFGQYFRQRILEKLPQKMRNEFVVTVLCSEIFPTVSCPFREK